MPRLSSLKRFARNQVNQLSLEFPISTWERTDDPVKLNAIFAPKEWKRDSPVSHLTEFRQDWIHWFECDPAEDTYVEIFFRRFQEQVAFVWARLRVNNRLFVLPETFYKDNSAGHVYSAGGIRLECTAPMRGWRLALNLMMEEPATSSKVHVRLGAQVAMTGHTLELPKQVRHSFLARRFYREEHLEKARHEISKCSTECQAILQPNSAFAEIVIDGQRQETMLFGSRLKCFGNSAFLLDVPIHTGYAENGTWFAAIKAKKKAYGYCCNPTEYVQPIRKTRWDLEQVPQTEANPQQSLIFEAGGRHHELKLGASRTPLDNVGDAGSLVVDGATFKMQSTLIELPRSVALDSNKEELIKLLQYPCHRNHYLLLSTSDSDCKNPKLTGGKGSSLAVLTDISKHFKSFTVPAAVVLTVKAYEMFAETPEVSAALQTFLKATKNADMAALRRASDECVATISKVILPAPIQTLLIEKLQEVFGFNWFSKKFAVRSSAVGEDSEEMSAAGQMTTFLGMRGERKISAAVVQCWASQFALTAVNYKRQYGQDLNGSMAVVVQEMVSAECAGVMFTCDPVTSNPSGIYITANYGLGESVVSATADPDTFSLRRAGSGIELIAKSCGAKNTMVVELEYGNGTEEKQIAADKAQSFCLTDERAIQIATIGAALSDVTDTPRDIEWAVVQGNIYLLQSRPVTSFFRESDFEIRHDYNSGFYTNREILSRANLDEVLPGAFSTLGVSIVGHLLFAGFNKTRTEFGGTDRTQFAYMQNSTCGKKTFMNFSQKGLAKNKTLMKSTSVAMFGYDISEHEAIREGIIHGEGDSAAWALTKMLLKSMWNLSKTVKEVRTAADKMTIDLPKDGDSLAQFRSILRQVPKMDFFLEGLMNGSMPSGIYNMFTLNLVKQSQGLQDFSPELMLLLSKLLRSDLEVESAHIPKELTVLSNLLREDPMAENFLKMSPEEALEWLEKDTGKAAEKFRTVRTKHAHRCYKEFDVHAKTWDIDPIPLVQTLQATVRAPEQSGPKKEEESITIDQLRPTLMQRKLLNYFIPRAKYAVYAREATKSALVKSVHHIRLALRKVGDKLHAEGRLPDPELIFFLNCDEIYRLLTTKDPSLLPRALRRQKMHPVLDRERFPVLFYGMPKPIDSSTITIDPNAQSLKGTPVSEGVVVGPARVVFDFLTEAHLIQKGEILITRATDTGWTPYFPLLGGVVTEVGGLLSHGAVVAREYGLPAIVGLVGVTEFVKTGDIVTLDGNRGILHKSAAPQQEPTEGRSNSKGAVSEEIAETQETESAQDITAVIVSAGSILVTAEIESPSADEEPEQLERNEQNREAQPKPEQKAEETEGSQTDQSSSIENTPDPSAQEHGTTAIDGTSSDTTPLIECGA